MCTPGESMGLLLEGTLESWAETKKHAEHVKLHGARQFINSYRKNEGRKDPFLWGDEVEYMLIKIDNEKKTAKVSLRAEEILDTIQEDARDSSRNATNIWHAEYAAYALEGIPENPYSGLMTQFTEVENSMRQRRRQLADFLEPNEFLVSLTSFPRLGTVNFCDPEYSPATKEGVSSSSFLPDQCISKANPRFEVITRHIRKRREEKVALNIPVYQDKFTKSPYLDEFIDITSNVEYLTAAKPDHIHMDCTGFGSGNCCLQVTLQAYDVSEAMKIYDELCPLCPIMLALSAAAPIYKGYLSDIDTRWPVLTQACDDRTREERGIEPLRNDKFRIRKSRSDSVDWYLSECHQKFNDVDIEYDEQLLSEMVNAGIGESLAKHVAHIFVREPLTLIREKLDQNDNEEMHHFDNIQSTVWQTLRFKPPPPNTDIGWRVEFRPMDVQLTDFENAAYVVFVMLLTRVILTYKLSFVVPISKVEENMELASRRNAVRNGHFFFRKDIFHEIYQENRARDVNGTHDTAEIDLLKKESHSDILYTKMTINEIINGSKEFPGLIPLINNYVSSMDVDVDTRGRLSKYLGLISKRASGEVPTTAKWIRNFVLCHPDYKRDSFVPQIINYDLMKRCVCLNVSHCEETTSGTKHQIPEVLRNTEQ